MDNSLILVPFVGMLLLTLIIYFYMYYRRITAILSSGVKVKTREDLAKLPTNAVNASDNFQNLFEVPVIFYVCVLAIYITKQVDIFYMICAFGFLLFRTLHSIVHCSYNNIMHRFTIHAISSLFAWIMVFRLSFNVLTD
jgi:hypothetical protein